MDADWYLLDQYLRLRKQDYCIDSGVLIVDIAVGSMRVFDIVLSMFPRNYTRINLLNPKHWTEGSITRRPPVAVDGIEMR